MEDTIGSPSKNIKKYLEEITMSINTISVSNMVEANVASMALYDLWVNSALEIVDGIKRDAISKRKLGPVLDQV